MDTCLKQGIRGMQGSSEGSNLWFGIRNQMVITSNLESLTNVCCVMMLSYAMDFVDFAIQQTNVGYFVHFSFMLVRMRSMTWTVVHIGSVVVIIWFDVHL